LEKGLEKRNEGIQVRYLKYRNKTCQECGDQFGSMGNARYCYTCKDIKHSNPYKRQENAKEKQRTLRLIRKGL